MENTASATSGERKDLGPFDSLTVPLQPHASVLYKVSPSR